MIDIQPPPPPKAPIQFDKAREQGQVTRAKRGHPNRADQLLRKF